MRYFTLFQRITSYERKHCILKQWKIRIIRLYEGVIDQQHYATFRKTGNGQTSHMLTIQDLWDVTLKRSVIPNICKDPSA
jgi:hypothetical protein